MQTPLFAFLGSILWKESAVYLAFCFFWSHASQNFSLHRVLSHVTPTTSKHACRVDKMSYCPLELYFMQLAYPAVSNSSYSCPEEFLV
ncbi:hypothetical protein BDD12DRAFT_465453 [Trichophaea hybrida]|nr:hypothetical protein BDD12DRAFT_465453 [Trichophaea hybrida]